LKVDLRPVDSVCSPKLRAVWKTLSKVGFVQPHRRGYACPRLHRGKVASITIRTQDGKEEDFESGNCHPVIILRNRSGRKEKAFMVNTMEMPASKPRFTAHQQGILIGRTMA
jgi:hypothetical protein